MLRRGGPEGPSSPVAPRGVERSERLDEPEDRPTIHGAMDGADSEAREPRASCGEQTGLAEAVVASVAADDHVVQ